MLHDLGSEDAIEFAASFRTQVSEQIGDLRVEPLIVALGDGFSAQIDALR